MTTSRSLIWSSWRKLRVAHKLTDEAIQQCFTLRTKFIKHPAEGFYFNHIFPEDLILDTKILSKEKINGLIGTFPPVWEPELNHFELRHKDGYELFMVVRIINDGFVSYNLGKIDITHTPNQTLIKDLHV